MSRVIPPYKLYDAMANKQGVRVMVFNISLNTISAILWRSALLAEEAGVPGGKPSTYRKALTNFITFS